MDNMITFVCDRCQKKIDSKQELRFVVSVEVEAAMDFDEEDRPDREYINELQELLESLDTVDCAEISDKAYQKKSYDLCEQCCQEYLKNPLAIEQVAPMGYSNN